jgi:putative lipoprotein (rSAM/lipoprotein system)
MNASNQNRYLKRRKIFKTIFGIFSLSGIMFAFQACYGTPQDFGLDVQIKGKVTSAMTKASVPGIRVQVNQSGQYTQTTSDGNFSIYCERLPEYNITFLDTDGAFNGQYQVCDTTIQLAEKVEVITVNVELK